MTWLETSAVRAVADQVRSADTLAAIVAAMDSLLLARARRALGATAPKPATATPAEAKVRSVSAPGAPAAAISTSANSRGNNQENTAIDIDD